MFVWINLINSRKVIKIPVNPILPYSPAHSFATLPTATVSYQCINSTAIQLPVDKSFSYYQKVYFFQLKYAVHWAEKHEAPRKTHPV